MKLPILIVIAATSLAVTIVTASAEPSSCIGDRVGMCSPLPSSPASVKPLVLAQNKFCSVSDTMARREAQILDKLLTSNDCRFIRELYEGYAFNKEKRCAFQTMMKYFHEVNSNVTLEPYVPEGKLPLGSIGGNFPPDAPPSRAGVSTSMHG